MQGFRLDFGQGRWFDSSHLHHFNYTTMSTKSETDVAYTKGYAHGFLIATDTFQEILEKSSKDAERLEWILDQGSYWLSSREDIDKEMEDTLTNE